MKRLNQRQALSAYELAATKDSESALRRLMNVAELMELILNNIYSGIICCDRDCIVVFMNKVFGELIGVDPRAAVGTKITEYFPDSRLPGVMDRGIPDFGDMCQFRKHTEFIVNRIPIKSQGRVIGAVLQSIHKDYKGFKELMVKLVNLERKADFYRKGFAARFTFDDIIGKSEQIQTVKKAAERYAKMDAPVLILGATGTGKELFAHAVHNASAREKGLFVCVNCAGIPKELIESELFGYGPGAFTGASVKGKAGKIELADRGTLFLDEIGDLPLGAQAKILRVLETKTMERLGELRSFGVDFRIIAATNKDLKKLIKEARFREDLYYRLNSLMLEIPPLSSRVEDVPVLISHFLACAGKPQIQMTEKAMGALMNYSWPGNIRELRNVIERTVCLMDSDVLDTENIPWEISRMSFGDPLVPGRILKPLAEELARFEESILRETLTFTSRNMSKAAKLLNISRSTLYEKCDQYKLREL